MNRLPLFLCLLFSSASIFAQSYESLQLRALPDSARPFTIETVRNYWINSLPKLVPPSQSSRNYASNMPTYRKNLAARNQFIARIRAGEFDDRAECAMLEHNARLADRLRKFDEAARLRARLKQLHEGSAKASELAQLRMKVEDHCHTIQMMQKEIELLKLALSQRK